MSQATYHPLEEILRLIARNAPHPWYPRQFLRESRADPDQVSSILEHLALEGLIEKVRGGSLEGGSGVVLTELGHEVVGDPALMDRLIRGEALRPDDIGGIIRNDLRTAGPPYATYALIAVNVLIFFAIKEKSPLYDDWTAFAGKVKAGQWWRLITCTFLHLGIMHIGCNMFSLYSVGSFVEQAWGRWRFLVLYLVSGWAGSCLAMGMQPDRGVVGASGAVCGVLGAIGVWFLLYRRYLRPEAASSGLWQVGTSIALIALMGWMIPNVSNWGHLGGGIGGALAALVLHVQRFGLPGVRLTAGLRWVIAGMLLVILPAASYMQMKNAWARAERPLARQDDADKDRDKDDRDDKDGKPPKKDGKK